MMQLDLIYGQTAIDLALYNLTSYTNSNFTLDFINQKLVLKYFFFQWNSDIIEQ